MQHAGGTVASTCASLAGEYGAGMTYTFVETYMAATTARWSAYMLQKFRTNMTVLAALAAMNVSPVFLPAPALAQGGNNSGVARGESASPLDAAREAFEALPEAVRRKIQDNLVWSGDYKGGVDGEFGRMTHAAIRAFEKRISKSAGDGMLSSQDIDALDKLAARARAGAGFREIRDPVSGITIGLPAKILPRTSAGRSGTTYLSANKQAQLSLFQLSGEQADLKKLYADLRNVPGQKVTYGVLRSEFLVVTAERANEFVYTRAASGEGSGKPLLRAFTLTYPKSQRRIFEKLVIATSNSFKPFATAALMDSKKPEQPAPPLVMVSATALAVAPDTYVTVLGPGACREPRIGKAPATLLAHDRTTGLALMRAPVGGGSPVVPVFKPVEGDQAVFALFAESTGPVGDPQISLTRGQLRTADGNKRLHAAMPVSGTGALLSTQSGVIAGFAGFGDQTKLAGLAPPASRPVIEGVVISSFLTAAGIKIGSRPEQPASTSPSAVAEPFARALAPLSCIR